MRYFIALSYNGKNYHGWQIQPDANSVQSELINALQKILQEKILVVGAGRTDTGVHAKKMIAHFDSNQQFDNWVYKINSVLPNDIVVSEIFLVDDEKHARFDAKSRTYEYKIWLGRNPFLLDFSWQIHHQKIDIHLMNEAAKLLFNFTNFESFSKVQTEVKTFNCEITKAIWEQNGNELTFYISANRFLRNMVRAIVGTLIDVGTQKISVKDFEKIIESKDRGKAGLSVPAKGLFLTEVDY